MAKQNRRTAADQGRRGRRSQMTASAQWPRAAEGNDPSPNDSPPPDRARSRWRPVQRPTNRAILGGLLVALSALGLYAATAMATEDESTSWLVARRAIPPGSTVTKDDLALARGSLPPAVSGHLLADWRQVIGKVTSRPIERDSLITTDAVQPVVASDAKGRRVSVELPRASALGGAVSVGQRLDVVAIGDGDEPAAVVAPRATVVAVSSPQSGTLIDSGAGSLSNRVVVTVIVASVDEATAVLAASKGGLSLIEPAEYPS